MKIDGKFAVVLIAGIAVYQLLGPYLEHLKGLVDSLVITELAFRAVRLGKPENSDSLIKEIDDVSKRVPS